MGLCRPVIAAALVAVCGLASAAAAQQYRGDGGTLLDRNLQVGSGGKNVRARDVRDQIWFNNQIITGNAPAGRSFRGYVGYTSPAQFRGATGTDSQYNFLRDSSSAAAVSTGVRASDALRYQFALTTGQSAPAYMADAYFTARGSNAATVVGSTGSTESAMRSTADYMSARALRPTLIGSRRDAAGTEWTATASNLLGLTWIKVNPVNPAAPSAAAPAGAPPVPGTSVTPGAPALPGPTTSVTPGAPTVPTLPTDLRTTGSMRTGVEAQGLGYRIQQDAANRGIDNAAPSDARRGLDTAVQSSAVASRSAAHAQMLNSLRGAYKPGGNAPGAAAADSRPDPTADPNNVMDRELERIRRVLQGQPAVDPAKPRTPPGPGESLTPSGSPAAPKAGPKPGGDETKAGPDAKRGDKSVTPEIVRALKSLGEKSLDSFTPGDSGPGDPKIYKVHMDAGQQLLAEERYFDAEDRFTRAIASMPDDPMAKAGRVHAQLGAGLYLSASNNLRLMIKTHPEVVGLRFDRKLAPGPERTKSVADQLRVEIDRGSTGVGLESSLLLAYLGRITGDQTMTDEGLKAMSERQPEGDAKEAAFYELLNGVWGSAAASPAK